MNTIQDQTIHFIEAYKRKPILWDTMHPFYTYRPFRHVAWYELAAETSLTVDKCRVKVANLRQYYSRVRMELQRYRMTGIGSGKCSWHAYERLYFLAGTFNLKKKPIIKRRTKIGECPEQRQSPLQITGAQNPITHLRSELDITNVEAIRPHENNIDDQVMLNTESNNFAPVENTENEIKCRLITEVIFQKLKSYPPQMVDMIENVINNILLEADRVVFE